MPGLRVEVDGEKGFSGMMENGALLLRKGPKKVRMPFSEISSVARGRRHRYGRTMFWIGIALLPALGLGAIPLAIYYYSGYDALVIGYHRRKYAISGEGRTLRVIRERIGRNRKDLDTSSEE